jgi:hypothetical protein
LNQQQAKHIQNQINNVHQPNHEPHFDFIVNKNYTDLEKASEQFVNLGRLAGKSKVAPKVVKITKTVAVKQYVPVPVVKVIKEQIPVETHHSGYHGLIGHPSNSVSPTPTTERPYEQVSYVPHHPTKSPSPTASSYQSVFSSTTTPSPSEYDTEPFYIRGPHKEMIKIVPVPYYVDEHGNKHEITTSPTTSSHEFDNSNGHDYYTNHEQTAPSTSSMGGDEGKFKSHSFSYHPSSQHHNNHAVYAHDISSNPEEEYYYHHENRDSVEGASESHNQHSHPSDAVREHQQEYCSDEDDEYRYKYLTYEQ